MPRREPREGTASDVEARASHMRVNAPPLRKRWREMVESDEDA